jgi:sulfatase modifying factor 1
MKHYLNFPLALLLLLGISQISNAEAAPEKMKLIKGGCFQMGTAKKIDYHSGIENYRERPVHEVCVDSFFMDIYETTQKEWATVIEGEINVHRTAHHGDDLPMDHIDFPEALRYCKKLGKRLPTEAEWEYAARAGSTTLYPWGDKISRKHSWYSGSAVRKPHPVGTRKPNAWGLHDMIGSVWEWTYDWYGEHYYKSSPKDNPKGPKGGSWRVIRGGSWIEEADEIRSAVRFPGMQDGTEHFHVGVRCVKDK